MSTSPFSSKTNRPGFTLIELGISVLLFALAITVALFATVSTNSLIARTDVRSAVAESGRNISEIMRRVVANSAVGAVSELVPYTAQNYAYAGVRVKGFSPEHAASACQIVGRATVEAGANPNEETFVLAANGTVIAYWIYEVDTSLQCPLPSDTGAILYQNRLTDSQTIVTDFAVKLVNFPCESGCTGSKQVVRYRFGLESATKLAGSSSETQSPSLASVDSLPVGLINENISAPTILTTGLSNGTIAASYSQDIVAENGVTPYVWEKTAGILPTGLTLNQVGTKYVLSGTPTQTGTYNFVVKVTDANTNFDTQSLSVQITAGGTPLTIQENPAPPGGQTALSYSFQFIASGGQPPYSNWIKTVGTLPPGLSLSTSGLLSGTPITPGSYNFTVQVSDSLAATDTAPFSIVVIPGGTLLAVNAAPPPPAGTVGTPYSHTFTASGGVAPYSNWQVISGTVPTGCTNASLNSSTGTFACTPSAVGTFVFTVRVGDSVSSTASRQVTIIITSGGDIPVDS